MRILTIRKIFLSLTFLIGTAAWAETDRLLTLRCDPSYFSPNDDGFQDRAFFSAVLSGREKATRWRLDVSHEKKGRIARLNGAGLPALIEWDGFDKKGLRGPEGAYKGSLTVWTTGRTRYADVEFYLDDTAPMAQIVLSTDTLSNAFLYSGTLTLTPQAMDESPIDRWQIQILDSMGRNVLVYWSTGPFRAVDWDGKDKATGVLIPQGKYQCAFQAWDKAGNESPTFFTDLKVEISPRAMLERELTQVQIYETGLGLLIQLPTENLFRFKGKKAVFNQKAGGVLRETAIIINAYPDVPVTIEGYSKLHKNATKDRDQASFYAWSVYSHLVKKGHVKASRLSVKGRGRSAMFTRRAVSIPFLKNGVEILLEGDRQW